MNTQPTRKKMTEERLKMIYAQHAHFGRITTLESSELLDHITYLNGEVEQLGQMMERAQSAALVFEKERDEQRARASRAEQACRDWAVGVESSNTDIVDLQRDEFRRIMALTKDYEIIGLCKRAIETIEQVVPVLVQRDRLENANQTLTAKNAELVKALELIGHFPVEHTTTCKCHLCWCVSKAKQALSSQPQPEKGGE